MDEKINSQDNSNSENDTNNLNENCDENITEETDQKNSSETTLMQDLLNVTGLAFLRSKRKAKEKKEENLEKSNEQPSTICYIEEQPTDIPNQENTQPDNDTGLQFDNSSNVITKKLFSPKRIIFSILFLVVAFILYKTLPFLLEPNPPSKDVVATYNNKNITVDQLMEYIKLEDVRENEHEICEKHNFDHSKCNDLEECETHPVHSLESYQQIVKIIAVEKIIDDWANKNGITQRNDIEHGLKDLIKDINLESLLGQIHEKELSPDSIPKWEVQQYFDENKDTYNGKAFNDVEVEIREILAAQKDESFFPEYIDQLKQSAGLNVNLEILKVDNPTEEELKLYYEKNTDSYVAKAKVNIIELKIDVKNDAKDAMKIANEALSRLRAGESFDSIVQKYSVDNKTTTVSVTQGERGEAFDKAVFNLRENDVSDAFEYEGNVYIVKLLSKEKQKQNSYSEVKEQIKEILLKEKTKEQYNLQKAEALFTVHGKRYTLGEFAVEFDELPIEYQTAFAGYEGKKRLVEQMIAKELLLEEYGDETQSAENKHKIDDIKKQYLSQILHKEEIDSKLGEISDTEAEEFYQKNEDNLIEPAKVKLSLIWIDEGANGEKSEQANARANKALKSIQGGADFSEVAKQYSEDATASTGGVIDDWLNEEYLPPDIAKIILSLKANEVSSVMQSQGGLYIVKIREKEEQRKQRFDEVKEAIKNHLLDEKHLEMEADLERELLEKSELTIYNKTLRALLKTSFAK